MGIQVFTVRVKVYCFTLELERQEVEEEKTTY